MSEPSSPSETVVRLSAKLFEARDAARAICVDDYWNQVIKPATLVVGLMFRYSITEMETGMQLLKDLRDEVPEDTTLAEALILAAVVELTEGGLKIELRPAGLTGYDYRVIRRAEGEPYVSGPPEFERAVAEAREHDLGVNQ